MRPRSPVLGVLLLASVAAADPAEIPQHTVWVGSYTCAQGLTSIRLTIETRSSGGEAMGLFEFGPHEKNPKLPRGSFWMAGRISRDGRGQLAVKLAPDRWKMHPAGWVMVPITASGDREDTTLTGEIDFAGCGAIHVHRAPR